MEAQLHRTDHDEDRHYDDSLDHPAGTRLHGEKRDEETRSAHAMKKVKEKVDKLKATIKHGHGHHRGEHIDEAQAVNESPVVRSGLAEPTVMGTPVLAEDLYATHSDILDPPVRSFAQWEDEERHGSPPPLSTDYETHHLAPRVGHLSTHGHGHEDVHELEGGIAVLDKEEANAPPVLMSTGGTETHLTGPPHVDHDAYRQDASKEQLMINKDEKEVGITGVLKSFDKMKVYDEPNIKSSESDQKVYTGSHDQFKPEPVENPPLDTIIADNPSQLPNISYMTGKISSVTSAISNKAAAVKESIVSKLSSSSGEENKNSESKHKTASTSSSFPTDFSHKVADTLSGTLGPVYETVAEVGSSLISKKQGHGHDDATGSPTTKMVPESRGFKVKEYLVDTFKPGDDDKVLSEVITHAFHLGNKGNQSPDHETAASTTTYVIRDEGERKMQDSCN